MVGEFSKERVPRQLIVAGGVILAAVVFAAGAKICLELGMAWRCPLITMTGLPCPSCGSTRAFAALAEMNILSAFKFNPLIVTGLLALPLLGFSKRAPAGAKRHGWTIFVTLVVLNWLYLFLFLPR